MRRAARAVNRSAIRNLPLSPGCARALLGAMKRALSLAFGAALLGVGLYGLFHSLLLAQEIPIGILSGACLYAVAGAYWLWSDLPRSTYMR